MGINTCALGPARAQAPVDYVSKHAPCTARASRPSPGLLLLFPTTQDVPAASKARHPYDLKPHKIRNSSPYRSPTSKCGYQKSGSLCVEGDYITDVTISVSVLGYLIF